MDTFGGYLRGSAAQYFIPDIEKQDSKIKRIAILIANKENNLKNPNKNKLDQKAMKTLLTKKGNIFKDSVHELFDQDSTAI